MRDCITFAISRSEWAVCGARTWLSPLKLFPIHSPHPPTLPDHGRLVWPLSQTNKRSFQSDGGGEMHPFVKSSCILSRLPFPQDLSVLFQSEEAIKSANWTLPTWRGPFVLTPPESLLSSELDSCLGCGSLHRTRESQYIWIKASWLHKGNPTPLFLPLLFLGIAGLVGSRSVCD